MHLEVYAEDLRVLYSALWECARIPDNHIALYSIFSNEINCK